MPRCRATTKKGTRCKNPAMEGSRFCGVHRDADREGEPAAEAASRGDGRRTWTEDMDELTKVALGAAVLGVVVLLAITWRR